MNENASQVGTSEFDHKVLNLRKGVTKEQVKKLIENMKESMESFFHRGYHGWLKGEVDPCVDTYLDAYCRGLDKDSDVHFYIQRNIKMFQAVFQMFKDSCIRHHRGDLRNGRFMSEQIQYLRDMESEAAFYMNELAGTKGRSYNQMRKHFGNWREKCTEEN